MYRSLDTNSIIESHWFCKFFLCQAFHLECKELPKLGNHWFRGSLGLPSVFPPLLLIFLLACSWSSQGLPTYNAIPDLRGIFPRLLLIFLLVAPIYFHIFKYMNNNRKNYVFYSIYWKWQKKDCGAGRKSTVQMNEIELARKITLPARMREMAGS